MFQLENQVKDAFKKILKSRKKPKVEPIIDGKAGFLYMNSNGTPIDGQRWAKILQNLTRKYNETFRVQIPKVTPHVCRHTYCSNMAKSGMNPKALQYLMGHSDIGVTLNTYTHLKYEDAQDALFTVLEETDKTAKTLKLVR